MKCETGDKVTFLRVCDAADKHQAYLDGVSASNCLVTGRVISQGSQMTSIFVRGNVLFVNNNDIQNVESIAGS
jgi:hypothetical protein